MSHLLAQFKLVEPFPPAVAHYPQLRFMGSKFRLLPWLYDVLSQIDFHSVLDAFSGSGCVAYLLKCMGKRVVANDFMNFSATIAQATTENPGIRLNGADHELLTSCVPEHARFIEETFRDIFFTEEDLRFLDRVWANLPKLKGKYKKALAISALIRSCAKRQPRGVFTIAGNPGRYDDGRRDLKLSLAEHFREHVAAYNRVAFDNGEENRAIRGDVFDVDPRGFDLVYMDPPYVPRADDNCYMKRYHFLEGLSCYWRGVEIMPDTRVKKLKKPYTPFSYRRTSIETFDRMFALFSKSMLALSYSSNGYPDLDVLTELMRRHKATVEVFERQHRYHFGTHKAAERNGVEEYLILGE